MRARRRKRARDSEVWGLGGKGCETIWWAAPSGRRARRTLRIFGKRASAAPAWRCVREAVLGCGDGGESALTPNGWRVGSFGAMRSLGDGLTHTRAPHVLRRVYSHVRTRGARGGEQARGGEGVEEEAFFKKGTNGLRGTRVQSSRAQSLACLPAAPRVQRATGAEQTHKAPTSSTNKGGRPMHERLARLASAWGGRQEVSGVGVGDGKGGTANEQGAQGSLGGGDGGG
jgi:hypothetical protein